LGTKGQHATPRPPKYRSLLIKLCDLAVHNTSTRVP
jgi:hypothetical protein